MKNLYCLFRNFDLNRNFVNEEAPRKEAEPIEAGVNTQSGKPPFDAGKTEVMVASAVGAGLKVCDAYECKIEKKEQPWKDQTDQILAKIDQDPALKIALGTFLLEYVRGFGKEYELSGDISMDFYDALTVVGVPNSQVGFNTAWNDILFVAEKGVKDSKVKWPSEKLKAAVESARQNEKPPVSLASK